MFYQLSEAGLQAGRRQLQPPGLVIFYTGFRETDIIAIGVLRQIGMIVFRAITFLNFGPQEIFRIVAAACAGRSNFRGVSCWSRYSTATDLLEFFYHLVGITVLTRNRVGENNFVIENILDVQSKKITIRSFDNIGGGNELGLEGDGNILHTAGFIAFFFADVARFFKEDCFGLLHHLFAGKNFILLLHPLHQRCFH